MKALPYRSSLMIVNEQNELFPWNAFELQLDGPEQLLDAKAATAYLQ